MCVSSGLKWNSSHVQSVTFFFVFSSYFCGRSNLPIRVDLDTVHIRYCILSPVLHGSVEECGDEWR